MVVIIEDWMSVDKHPVLVVSFSLDFKAVCDERRISEGATSCELRQDLGRLVETAVKF